VTPSIRAATAATGVWPLSREGDTGRVDARVELHLARAATDAWTLSREGEGGRVDARGKLHLARAATGAWTLDVGTWALSRRS
jgi:hypothetical protein